ncbi:MAG: hypothetical protein ABS897_07860 [Eubacteriales bacterium]
MTIEESVQKDPQGFRELLDTRTKEIKGTLNDLSARLDEIIGGAIREYGEKTGTEVDFSNIPSYKTLNKIITGKLDDMIREHTAEKRKDL